MKKLSTIARMAAAFTLVEVLAALAVLSILMVIILGLMTSATKTVSNSQGRTETEEQARLVFATMASDFARMVRRVNADSVFKCDVTGVQAGNDYMYFYSETPGYYDTGVALTERLNLSLIGYLIETPDIPVTRAGATSETPYQYRLQRMAKGLCWDDTPPGATTEVAPVFVTYQVPNPGDTTQTVYGPIPGTTLDSKWPNEVYGPNSSTINMANYAVLGSDIFRLEYCFIYSNGKTGDWAYYNATDAVANASTHIYGLQDVTGIIVTVAAIDESSRNLILTLKGIAGMKTLAAKFPDSNIGTPVNQPNLPSSSWQNMVSSGSLAAALVPQGFPSSALSQVRVFQHVFYLNKL